MQSSNQLTIQIERIEKFLAGKMSDQDAEDYKQELAVKYMTPEEKEEWADGAADRNAEIAEKAQAKKVSDRAAAKELAARQ